MEEVIRLGAPATREEIRADLRRVEGEALAYLESLPVDRFFLALGASWSPADNVRHLLKSIQPVTLALRLPRIVLRTVFGRAARPSRPFDTLRQDYAALLAAGGQAGRFAPAPRPAPADPAAARRRLLLAWRAAHASFDGALSRWAESDLDRLRLPHPLLGQLTLREMSFFTVYHTAHHVRGVARRMEPKA